MALDNNIENYLSHHGIKGQKWGVRRYQNADGSLTDEGRKRAGLDSKKKNPFLKEKKSISAEATINENGKEKLRNEIIKNPKKLPKYQKVFSKKEVDDMISEIQWNRKVSDIKREETMRSLRKIQDVSMAVGTLSNLMNNSINAWNNASAINNALIENGIISSDSKMPRIKTGEQKENKDKEKKD